VSARLVGAALPRPRFRTLNDCLDAGARSAFGLTFVDARENETKLSWADVRHRARRMAAALAQRGIEPGDRVAMVLPTGADFMDAFFGALLAGAVPVPLYPPVRLGRMDEYARSTGRMLEVSGAKIVLADRRIRLLLGKALDVARPALGCPTVVELMQGRDELAREITPDSLGLLQFSSGSTVDPKPVALTHANLLAQLAALRALLVERPGTHEKGVSWLPLYHDMGLIGCLLVALYSPGDLVLLPPEAFLARPALWLRALSRHRATISPAPNFAYGLCLKRVRDDELEGVDLSAWTYALNGAEPVSHEIMERFCERFARHGFRREALMPVYGLSEAALALTFTPAEGEKRVCRVDAKALALDGDVRPGERALVSVGVPVPGCEIEIRGEDGALAAERRVGAIFARADFVMKEYFGNPAATERALRDGWLDTGDLGFVDAGELYVCGRAKDVVIIRGANHAPQEFEECLESLAGVRAGCAVALGFVPDDTHAESLLILAESADDPPADLAQQIASAIAARSGIRPHTVVVLAPGTLPRTSSGKLRRGEALRRFLAGELRAPGAVNLLSVGAEMARSALAHARRKLGA
jgi:acyl-CoA synthetase (AMP-forming)/AMP-acid ligase II